MYYDEVNGGNYHLPLDSALAFEKDDSATINDASLTSYLILL